MLHVEYSNLVTSGPMTGDRRRKVKRLEEAQRIDGPVKHPVKMTQCPLLACRTNPLMYVPNAKGRNQQSEAPPEHQLNTRRECVNHNEPCSEIAK